VGSAAEQAWPASPDDRLLATGPSDDVQQKMLIIVLHLVISTLVQRSTGALLVHAYQEV